MKINIISSKFIKPHTPTPQNLRNYRISFLDKLQIQLKFAVVLFYGSKPENSRQLEESLAKILVQFYPLAGRYTMNDPFVDCSDQGVEFIEAEAVDVELSADLMAKNTNSNHQLDDLLPDQYSRSDAPNLPLLSIQVTGFASGGAAIAIAISHRVTDASSLETFIATWSSATNPNGKIEFTPYFNLPSLLPIKDHDHDHDHGFTDTEDQNIVVKRLLFDKVALTSLRSKLSPNRDGKTISRVRVASALIAKAVIGIDRAKARDFVIIQAINMRERTKNMLIPKHACGNLAVLSLTRRVAASESKEIGLQELVDLIGDAVENTIAEHAEIFLPHRDGRDIIINSHDNCMKEIVNPEMNAILFSDWSKFGFYEADFGWGKPVWTSIGPAPSTVRFVNLMSNKEGDGIEAWVHLEIGEMRYFEQDDEIRSYLI